MASLQNRDGNWQIQFMFKSQRHTFALGKVEESEAVSTREKVDYLLMRIKQKLIKLPPACSIIDFVRFDGNPPSEEEKKDPLTLAKLRDNYLSLHDQVLDPRTISDMRGHWKHLHRLISDTREAETVGLADLQHYVMARVKEGVESATAKKEIITCWNWGKRMSLIVGPFPNRGLRYPKGREKPPFMTFAEVARRIAAGESEELWESVFLTRPEIDEFLELVRSREQIPWLYPLLSFTAHTGARRSELLRALVTDVNVKEGTVLIREKKRRRDVEESTRRVPLSPFLKETMTEWLAVHPGGTFLFCNTGIIERSKKRSKTTGHKGEKTRASDLNGRAANVKEREAQPESDLTRNEMHDHFHRALAGTKWEKLTGFHALRHSFIGACVSRGVDQRFIDEWVGHTTEEMRRRYRHLSPDAQKTAIDSVFA
jgi:integrase